MDFSFSRTERNVADSDGSGFTNGVGESNGRVLFRLGGEEEQREGEGK